MAGGIPLVRPLRESLLGEPIDRVMGIVNGTTNYILTRMTESGAELRRRPGRGPGARLRRGRPHRRRRGLRRRGQDRHPGHHRLRGPGRRRRRLPRGHLAASPPTTSRFAGRNGFVVKLLAIAEQLVDADGRSSSAVRVHPVMVPVDPSAGLGARAASTPCSSQGAAVGDLMFYGRGAGGDPTASAVLGDLIDAALNLRKGSQRQHRRARRGAGSARSTSSRRSTTCTSTWSTGPACWPRWPACSARHGVSIRVDGAGGPARDDGADLVFITHRARERDVQATLRDLRELDVVHQVGSVIRVLGDEPSRIVSRA